MVTELLLRPIDAPPDAQPTWFRVQSSKGENICQRRPNEFPPYKWRPVDYVMCDDLVHFEDRQWRVVGKHEVLNERGRSRTTLTQFNLLWDTVVACSQQNPHLTFGVFMTIRYLVFQAYGSTREISTKEWFMPLDNLKIEDFGPLDEKFENLVCGYDVSTDVHLRVLADYLNQPRNLVTVTIGNSPYYNRNIRSYIAYNDVLQVDIL